MKAEVAGRLQKHGGGPPGAVLRGRLVRVLLALQQVHVELLALYEWRLGGHTLVGVGDPPRWYRRMQCARRRICSAQARTEESIRRLKNWRLK